jgi:MOSC domain-containing protein YiiM
MTSLLLNGLPRVYQISVSHGSVPKLAVSEARITMLGVEGDCQQNPDIHGGPERAVCLFSFEVIQALQAEGHSIAPGSAGDNVTLAGLDWFSFKPGDRIGLGPVRLELVSYTAPCAHNRRWFLNGDFSRISQKKHPGWSRLYARVLTEGLIRTGDPITGELLSPHGHKATFL